LVTDRVFDESVRRPLNYHGRDGSGEKQWQAADKQNARIESEAHEPIARLEIHDDPLTLANAAPTLGSKSNARLEPGDREHLLQLRLAAGEVHSLFAQVAFVLHLNESPALPVGSRTSVPREREQAAQCTSAGSAGRTTASGSLCEARGSALRRSTRTVELHKYQMMEALGLHNRAELIHFGIKNEIVGEGHRAKFRCGTANVP
jgi:hypothetical protein